MRSSHRLWKRLAVLAIAAGAIGGASIWWVESSYAQSILPIPGLGSVTTTTIVRKPSLAITAVVPATSQSGISPSGPFQLDFNQELSKATLQRLETSQPGTWTMVNRYDAAFSPSAPLLPQSSLTIKSASVGPGGLVALNGNTLSKPIDLKWTAPSGSVLRMQQILAQLGYLPFRWNPLSPGTSRSQIDQLYNPVSGTFSVRYPSMPAQLQTLFQPGVDNNMTKGAMVAFERAHGIAAYSSIRPLIWPLLLSAEADGTKNPNGYTYAVVATSSPETLTLWNDGNVVLSTPVNTGISQTPTPIGTFFVYLRYPTQTMRGRNVNGSYYSDHGVKWVNYFDGSVAIHGFVRASYGFPQSLGCVELPVSQAAVAWKWLHYGSLVTVS